MPPLSSKNCFATLLVEEVYELNSIFSTDAITNDSKAIPTPPNTPKWEKQLPEHYVISSTPSSNSLKLNVSMQTLDTREVVASLALLDCGATGLFVNGEFMKAKNLMTRKLSQPINVFNVDGTPNEAGKVSEVWETVLQYRDHSEHVIFAVTCLGKQNIILRLDWLRERSQLADE
jgi:hypothetical protein